MFDLVQHLLEVAQDEASIEQEEQEVDPDLSWSYNGEYWECHQVPWERPHRLDLDPDSDSRHCPRRSGLRPTSSRRTFRSFSCDGSEVLVGKVAILSRTGAGFEVRKFCLLWISVWRGQDFTVRPVACPPFGARLNGCYGRLRHFHNGVQSTTDFSCMGANTQGSCDEENHSYYQGGEPRRDVVIAYMDIGGLKVWHDADRRYTHKSCSRRGGDHRQHSSRRCIRLGGVRRVPISSMQERTLSALGGSGPEPDLRGGEEAKSVDDLILRKEVVARAATAPSRRLQLAPAETGRHRAPLLLHAAHKAPASGDAREGRASSGEGWPLWGTPSTSLAVTQKCVLRIFLGLLQP